MSSVEVKSLFEESRYPSGWAAFCLFLYLPIGLILVVLRTFIALQALVAAAVLPELSAVRRFVLRSMSIVLGIVVKEEDSSHRNETARIIVSNHITPCDHLAVHILSSCVTPCTWGQPAPIFRVLGLRDFKLAQGAEAIVAAVRNHLESCFTPVLVLPEGSTTNGRKGLLKFVTWPFRVANMVQPVVLRTWRPYITQVCPTALATTFWADIFWFLFSPCTVFTVKYLSTIERKESESDSEFCVRVQKTMAESLGVVPTSFTSGDKTEYEKRFIMEQNRPVTSNPHSFNAELQRMARQVRDVLPNVPLDVVLRDLSRTRSVDVTITNILEGHIQYTPLPTPAPSPQPSPPSPTAAPKAALSKSSAPSAGPSNPVSQGSACLDTSAPTFPRSAQERMISFHERKARLIENAKRKYIEKHGLKIVGYNC